MKNVIGFSNKFFTLWNLDIIPIYLTDLNGMHHLVRENYKYTYIKNISFEFSKVREIYPNLTIDENLKGISNSTFLFEKTEDLCPNILKFGKYYLQDINDLLEIDFKYLIWVSDNMSYSDNVKYIRNLPEIIAYYQNLSDIEEKTINDKNTAFNKILQTGFYEFIATKNLSIHDYFAYMYINDNDLCLTLHFNETMFSHQSYNGFDYALPLIKGKAKRIKGKKLRIEFTENINECYTVNVYNVSIIE